MKSQDYRLPDVRRIVTGHNSEMRACVIYDGVSPKIEVRESGIVSTLIWGTKSCPAEITGSEDLGNQNNNLQPPPHGSWFRIVDFPPGAPGFMHRTDTIDYAICMEGEIDMEMDDGRTVHVRPHDILVQLGTNHSWINRGTQTCRIAFVLIDGKRVGAKPRGPGSQRLKEIETLPDGKKAFLDPVRRIVTTHDQNGSAIIMHDGLAPQRMWREPRGNISTLIWGTDETPAELLSPEDFGLRENDIEPQSDGSWVRVIDYPGKMTGRMHRTDSIDYAVCLCGEMEMELDDGRAVTFRAGDVMVQRATNHSWINKRDEPARIVFALLGSESPAQA